MTSPLRIAVSSCLLGENVRYDGVLKPCAAVRDLLPPHAELVPLCPETGAGMPVPREPVDLVGEPEAPRMVGVESGEDWTRRVHTWITEALDELETAGVHGFVLKSRSPSCGVGTASVYGNAGDEAKAGDGLLALAIRRRYPELPLVEDEDLAGPADVDAFVKAAASTQD